MSEFVYADHRAIVTLAPGESKLFRLPPTTRGTVLIQAQVLLPVGGGGGGGLGGGGSIPRRDRRGTDAREPSRPPDVGRTTRDRVVDHRGTARAPRPRIWDHVRDGVLVDGGVIGPVGPGSTTPTDLTMDLLLGGTIPKATHGHHILLQSDYAGEVWQLRLTRRAGGTGEQRYSIQAKYPSVLPLLSREVPLAAFQNAFDANWNQHPYVTMEMRDSVFHVRFDEQFRELYGLADYQKDLSWISDVAIGSLPDFTCSIRFSMRVEQHPITVNGVRNAPVMIVDGRSSIGLGVTLKFFLGTYGSGAGFVGKAEVRGISDNIPGIDVREEIEKAVQSFIDDLANRTRTAFSDRFTPWLIGEPHRKLYNIVVGDDTRRFRVDWVGARPPPSTEPVLSDEVAPTEPRPEPPPYLFDTPDETPPAQPTPGWEPHHPYVTSPGPLEAIQNIVVLMLENRSFDQVLGYLTREEGRADVEGLSTDDRRHWEEWPDNIPRVPHRAETTAWPGYEKPGPIHHVDGVKAQINGGRMDRFVANFAERAGTDNALLDLVKAYFMPAQLPAYRALTEEFAICDHWFTPHAGPTWPNRFITFTGDLNRNHADTIELDNPDIATMTPAQATTIFDHLGERGISWRVYEHGYSFLRLYGRYTFDTQNIVDFKTRFAADARAGQLPRLTFLEPDYVDLPPGNDDHPPADMADGQKLVATVVTALLDSPQWQNTMLIITYDEHGGFYDHVPPPAGPAMSGETQRGPRVPAFVVSPWIARGTVSKDVYDHTSIISTVLRTFCSPRPPRMSARADAANDLRGVLQPTARPRSDFDALYARLATIRDSPGSAPRKPLKLDASPASDDFHAVMRYVRSFT